MRFASNTILDLHFSVRHKFMLQEGILSACKRVLNQIHTFYLGLQSPVYLGFSKFSVPLGPLRVSLKCSLIQWVWGGEPESCTSNKFPGIRFRHKLLYFSFTHTHTCTHTGEMLLIFCFCGRVWVLSNLPSSPPRHVLSSFLLWV